MKKFHLLLSAALLMVFVACGDDSNEYNIGGRKGGDTPVQPDDRQSAGPEIAKYNLEFPALKGGKSIVIVHQGVLNDKLKKSGVNYSVEWDTEIRSQRWSCYQMYADNYKTGSQVSRYKTENSSLSSNGQYPNNPELPTQYQFTSDPYWGTGYDHGHICPSADRQRANEANYQTFFMTNMQPQCGTKKGNFNGGIWSDMENQVRTWAGNFDTLFVCKGGTIDKAEHIIEYIGSGNNRIATLLDYQHLGTVLRLDVAIQQHIVEAELEIAAKAVGIDGKQIDTGVLGLRIVALVIAINLEALGLGIVDAAPDRVVLDVPTVVPLVVNLYIAVPYHMQVGLGHLHLDSQLLTRQIERWLDAGCNQAKQCYNI